MNQVFLTSRQGWRIYGPALALEQRGRDFAAHSAIGTMFGAIAGMVSRTIYALLASRLRWKHTVAVSITLYFTTVAMFNHITLPSLPVSVITVPLVLVCCLLLVR